jgi:NAD+ diphosphatase
VVREVREEAAVVLDSVSYLGSQPWPFPASLMLGFIASCSGSQDPQPDGSELVEARWFERDEVRQGVASGELIVPPTLSIARRLVEHWLGGVLPDGPSGASWRPTR